MKIKEPLIDKVKRIYIVLFITYLMLSRMVLFVNVITMNVNSIIYNLLAAGGCVILLWDFILNLYEFKSTENIILLSFLLVCGASTIINRTYGYMDNLKTLVWTAIQFYILFSSLYIKTQEKLQHSMKTIMSITTGIWFISTVISLVQFLLQIGYRMDFSEFSRRQGFVDSRLFGIYSDPNFAAVTSLIMIIFSLFLFLNGNNMLVRFFHGLNIVLQLLYVVLSGSRTGRYEAVILAFILPLLLIRNTLIKRRDRNYKIKSLAMAALITAIVLVFTKYSAGPLIKLAQIRQNLMGGAAGEHISGGDIDLTREDVSEDDISNNRFKIWKSSVEVAQSSRIIGVSPRNLVPYAKANYPESYIAKTGYETHNGYLAVYVGTGIIGSIVISLFVLYMLYKILRYSIYRKGRVWNESAIVCFCTALVIGISALMLLDIFFVNTFSGAIFWLFTGYLLYIARRGRNTYE